MKNHSINYKHLSIVLGIVLIIFIIVFFVIRKKLECNLDLLINYLFDKLEKQNIKLPNNPECCPHCSLKQQQELIDGFNKCKEDDCSVFIISLLSGCGCGIVPPKNFIPKNFDKQRCADIFKKLNSDKLFKVLIKLISNL